MTRDQARFVRDNWRRWTDAQLGAVLGVAPGMVAKWRHRHRLLRRSPGAKHRQAAIEAALLDLLDRVQRLERMREAA